MQKQTAFDLIETGQFTVEQMIDIGAQTKDMGVWQAVVKHSDFNAFKPEQLFEFGKKADSEVVWKAIVANLQARQKPQ